MLNTSLLKPKNYKPALVFVNVIKFDLIFALLVDPLGNYIYQCCKKYYFSSYMSINCSFSFILTP